MASLHTQRAQGAQYGELPAAHILQLHGAARSAGQAARRAHCAASDALLAGRVELATLHRGHQLRAVG